MNMLLKFDKPTAKASNKSSCNGHISYMEKEDKILGALNKEYHFNDLRGEIPSHVVKSIIDGNTKGLNKSDSRFFTGSISLSPQELQHIKNDPKKFKQYCLEFFKLYAEQFKRGFSRDDFNYFCKLEYNRYHKSDSPEVRNGQAKAGDPKPGEYNMHVHFIVGRLTKSGKKASPNTNHRKNSNGAVKTSFCRDELIRKSEKLFDEMFRYERPLSERYEYYNQQKKASSFEKKNNINNQIDSDLNLRIFIACNSEKKVSNTKSKIEQVNYLLQKQEVDPLDTRLIMSYTNELLNGKTYNQLQNLEWILKHNRIKNLGNVNKQFMSYLKRCQKPFNGNLEQIDPYCMNIFVQVVNQELSKDFALSKTDIFPNEKKVDIHILDSLVEGISTNRKTLLRSIFNNKSDQISTNALHHSLVSEINRLYEAENNHDNQKLTMDFISRLSHLHSDQQIKSGLLALKGLLKCSYNHQPNLNLLLFSTLKNLQKKYNDIPKELRLQQLRKYVNYLNSKLKGAGVGNINSEKIIKAEAALNFSGKTLSYLNAINSKIKNEDYSGAQSIISQSPESFIRTKLYNSDSYQEPKTNRNKTNVTKTKSPIFDFDDNNLQTDFLFPSLPGFLFSSNDDDKDWNLRRKKKKKRKQ